MNTTARKEVECRLNYLNKGIFLVFAIFLFLIITIDSVEGLPVWSSPGFSCSDVGDDQGGQINCVWDNTVTGDPAYFEVSRRTTHPLGTYTLIATPGMLDSGFTDISVTDGTGYGYLIVVTNGTHSAINYGIDTANSTDDEPPRPPTTITAIDTPNIALAPRTPLFSVPSSLIISPSMCWMSRASIPTSFPAIILFTFSIALHTDFPQYSKVLSLSSTASYCPVDAPLGTAALPKLPSSRLISTSRVGLPRESRICLACILRIWLILF